MEARRIFYENFYDFAIFTQPLQADSTEGLREYGDTIEIFVEYPSSLREQYSRYKAAGNFALDHCARLRDCLLNITAKNIAPFINRSFLLHQ